MKQIQQILSIFIAVTFSLQAGDPIKVIADRAHGDFSVKPQLSAIAAKLNLELKTNSEPITASTLRDARLLLVMMPTKPFAAEEKAVIVEYVKGGGSLLVVLDEERRQSLEKTGVNDLITPFGLKLTADLAAPHNCGGLAKAGVIHATDREVPYSGGRAVEGGNPFAWQLGRDGQRGKAFATHQELGNGARLVVLGEAMAANFYGSQNGARLTGTTPEDTTYWGKDSVVFMEEILSWLVKNGRKNVVPSPR
jgi:hypothetical protein